jgi:topoisomerase-4 subunit A
MQWDFHKVLPHNFNELIDASIKILKETFTIYQFMTKGSLISRTIIMDCEAAVCVCVQIAQLDKNTLVITQIPF